MSKNQMAKTKTGRERLISSAALRILSGTVLQLEYPKEKQVQ